MYGLSYFIQFTTFGLIIFFSALFVNQYQVSMQDSLCSVSLILFGCVSAGGKSIFLQDLAGIKEAVGWTSIILAWKDEDELRAESGCKMLRTAIRGNI
jgi:1,4-dihydroxy-2-naphthoate octaprenyltransferase